MRWDAYLLILRAIAMFVLGNLPTFFIVPVFALLASYLELWPANALGAVWGDPARLFEDPAGTSSATSSTLPAADGRRRRHGHRSR